MGEKAIDASRSDNYSAPYGILSIGLGKVEAQHHVNLQTVERLVRICW